MYQVRDGFCFSAISFDWIDILSSYKDQIEANIFAQLLSEDGILISEQKQKKTYDHFRSDAFRTKKFLAQGMGHLEKFAKNGKIRSKNTVNKENINFYYFWKISVAKMNIKNGVFSLFQSNWQIDKTKSKYQFNCLKTL